MGGKIRSIGLDVFKKLRWKWIDMKGGSVPQITEQVIKKIEPKVLEIHDIEKYNSEIYPKLYDSLLRTISVSGCSEHNRLEVYDKGEDFYQNLWEEIDKSKERIWIETYIFVNDYVGEKTIQKLTEARKRGVQVVLIVDSFGSMFNLQKSIFQDLLDEGGFVYKFNNQWRIFNPFKKSSFSPFIRDHRKIAIVDDIGYVGGMNIENVYSEFHSDEDYKNGKSSLTEKERKKTLRDTQCRLEGECIHFLENVFRESFENVEQFTYDQKVPKGFKVFDKIRKLGVSEYRKKYEDEDEETHLEMHEELVENELIQFVNKIEHNNIHKIDESEQLFVQIVPSNPRKGVRSLQNSFYSFLNASNDYIYITTPYFVPPAYLSKKILEAADRGVKIVILTSGLSDVPFYKTCAQAIYDKFLMHDNIEIFEYQDKILHCKTFTMDGIYSSLGSYNLDRTSFLTHMEIMVNVYDPDFSEIVETQFKRDLELAEKLEYENWKTSRSFFSKQLGRFLYFLFKYFVRSP